MARSNAIDDFAALHNDGSGFRLAISNRPRLPQSMRPKIVANRHQLKFYTKSHVLGGQNSSAFLIWSDQRLGGSERCVERCSGRANCGGFVAPPLLPSV